MRRNGDIYKYIGVYVSDLVIAIKDPQVLIDLLTNTHQLKLKGTEEIKFYLGCDFICDSDGTLCMALLKYINKIIKKYECLFGSKPKSSVWSPLAKGNHPELDTTELLDEDRIQLCQSLIGSLQQAISLGCFDIATAVMSLSSFCPLPHQGHLKVVSASMATY